VGEQDEARLWLGSARRQGDGVLGPIAAGDLKPGLGEYAAIATFEPHGDRHGGGLINARARPAPFRPHERLVRPERHLVRGALLDRDLVKTAVGDAHPLAGGQDVEHQVMWIVGMQRAVVAETELADTAAVLNELPPGERPPIRLSGGGVFERAVLDQLGVETTVGSVVQIFEKDADEVAADGLARCREIDLKGRAGDRCGASTQEGGRKQENGRRGFHGDESGNRLRLMPENAV